MHPFRTAVESGDLSAVPAMLADDVTFLSPVAFAPYQGRELVSAILGGAFRVLEGLHYEKELASADGTDHALVFRATTGGKAVHGCDFLTVGADGLITDFTVMVRPLSAAHAVAEAMSIQFEAIKGDLGLAG